MHKVEGYQCVPYIYNPLIGKEVVYNSQNVVYSIINCFILYNKMAAIYRSMIKSLDKLVPPRFHPFWNHPAVIAGLGDLARPPQNLSASQSCALAATGTIWARYCLVIIPKNYYLCSVNVFVGSTGFYQLYRIFRYKQSLKSNPEAAIENSEE
ncbi:Mitochondrial pyruvate carrier 2 [Armadillidium nasatum]|uniref:Mitochondrial pyruvate carrier n=1 Tax=Armadillidium nasatum TaxID=96803 RepID=A0A5N5SK88_9CRUS|nr:Mitochondrial pyruvate carrier 2 [Armadillidium nasatum]